jgi:predicted  nucleic acid-binding Zn-ribbon protein
MSDTYTMIGSCYNCHADTTFEFAKGDQTMRKICPNCGCSTVATFHSPDKWRNTP